MKRLHVPYLSSLSGAPVETVSASLNGLERHRIDQLPWSKFPYKPGVAFSIAHAGNALLLKYYVLESAVRGQYNRPNEPVYKDSCVEFFVSLNGDPRYYNFEFNAIGTCLLYIGPNRNERKPISDQAILDIKFITTITNNAVDGNLRWEITIVIPMSSFTEHNLTSLRGLAAKGNFYKCGDELPNPHYLTWNHVTAPSPDFHRPESFGEISFE